MSVQISTLEELNRLLQAVKAQQGNNMVSDDLLIKVSVNRPANALKTRGKVIFATDATVVLNSVEAGSIQSLDPLTVTESIIARHTHLLSFRPVKAGGNIEVPNGAIRVGAEKEDGEKNLEAGGNIYARCGVFCEEGSIVAGKNIISGDSILAECDLLAGGFIKAGGFIRAVNIKAGESVFTSTYEVKAMTLSTRSLPLSPSYFIEQPPFKRYREALDKELGWGDLRSATFLERNEICSWEGWHPLLRAQLRMFYGCEPRVEI
jgi:hypothetical protein